MNPKVSVVIPTYNRKEMLYRALDSVIKQTYGNLEIIVVDDGSTDGSKEYIASLLSDMRVKYYFKSNEGLPSKSRNYGISRCTGEYISFLDSDDYWFPEKVEIQLEMLVQSNNAALTCSTATSCHNGTKVILSNYFYKKSGHIFWWLIFRNFIITSSVLIKKDIIDEIGIFKDTEDFKISEDYDLWLRISRKYPVCFIERPLLFYQTHEGNISSNIMHNLDHADRVIRLNLESIEIPSFLKNKLFALTPLKKFFYCRKNKNEARKLLKQVIEIDRFSFLARLLLLLFSANR